MKYIIEIEDKPITRFDTENSKTELFKAKGFNSLVFDKNGLDKLTPYNEANVTCRRAAYEQGAYDTWEIVKNLYKLNSTEKKDMFGYSLSADIIVNRNPQEVKTKLDEYEQNKTELQPGDIVRIKEEKYRGGELAIVISKNNKENDYRVLHTDFCEYTVYHSDSVIKTGAHCDLTQIFKERD